VVPGRRDVLLGGNSDVFIVKGPKVKVPRDFKKFFANTKNKIQLFKLILK